MLERIKGKTLYLVGDGNLGFAASVGEKIIISDHFIDKSIDLVSDQNISIGELCKKIKKIYPQFKFIRNRKNTKKVLIPKLTYLKKIFDKYDFKKIDQIIKECI